MNRSATRPGAKLLGSGIALALCLVACGNTSTSATATTAQSVAAIRSAETAAPSGVVVAGAQWIQITGAGGRSDNVQLAAVLRPPGNAPVPLVVWLHGTAPGFLSADVSAATRLAAGGFVVLVGCWTESAAEPLIRDGVSLPRVPCLKNFATPDEATEALIEAGTQLAGVKKGPFGLLGVSAGGAQATRFRAGRTGAGAIVLDSALRGQTKVDAPVLILGATGDLEVSVDSQRTYEQALRDSGTTVEAHYYEGGSHGVTVGGEFQEDAFKRIIDFYTRYLR